MSRIQSNRDFLLQTATQLENGIQLTKEQMEFWGFILRRIGNGEPPDQVLQLKRRPGEKESHEQKRQSISLVLHLIASKYKPLADTRFTPPKKYTLEQAILEVLPEVPRIMNDGKNYDFELVRNWWYDADKAHMQSPIRTQLDPNSPYK